MFTVNQLKTEYEKEPIGIDCEKPRFFWQLSYLDEENSYRGLKQSAYQIQVKKEDNTIVWDSGRVESQNTIGIFYEGEPLEPMTLYFVNVTVWNEKGEQGFASSSFETGLMCPTEQKAAWSGAKWIGGAKEDMTYYPHYLSVFKISYDLQIPEGSKKAGFVFGANDSRLMDKNKNLFHLENKKDESYFYLETDLADVKKGGSAYLYIYRVGYHTDDKKDVPFYTLKLEKLDAKNCHAFHTYHLWCDYGVCNFYLDGTETSDRINQVDPNDKRPPQFRDPGVNLNPVGVGNNYISFPMVADIGFCVPAKQTAIFSNIIVRNYRKPCTALYEDTKYHLIKGEYFAVRNTEKNAVPMLRTTFDLPKKILKARLFITARGIYEAYLNGTRIGEDWFNPGLTQYNKTHMYQTYDVTEALKQGKNAFGVLLGEGWWSGSISYTGSNWNFFGDRSSLLAKLTITFTDGTTKSVVTEPESWKLFVDGPIRYGSFFQGEVYDFRKESQIIGWDKAEFEDSTWKQAVEVNLGPDNTYLGEEINFDSYKLIGQVGSCVKTSVVLKAKSVEEVRKGVFLYDMGQNIAGVPRITISNGTKGQKITLRFAEITYPDLKEYKGNEKMIMLENIRAALAQDIFWLKEGSQVIYPRFTFHGYQYIEITGMKEALPLECVEGIALSSVPTLSASYYCSKEEVNQLFRNVTWSLRDNYISIPTDCPQRNERMGWSGDLSVFSRTAVTLTDSARFLERHRMALEDTQDKNGRFADIAPIGGGFGGVLWGSVGITVPYETYLQYKDIVILSDHYKAMQHYLDFLDTKIEKETGLLIEGPLGDWLGPEYSNNEPAFLWNAYHVYDLFIMMQVAKILEKEEDAKKYQKKYEERKEFFNQTFVDDKTHRTVFSSERAVKENRNVPMMSEPKCPYPKKLPNGKFLMDTQTSYAVPLALGIFKKEYEKDAARFLAEACARENVDNDNILRPPFSLMTGFIGTAWINLALSEYGYHEEAYRMLLAEDYPSWLYPVKQGATTIWERLNSYTKEEGFGENNSMNSFNHYSFGAVAAWLFTDSLGIKREIDAPGFSRFTLCPTPDPKKEMTFAKGYCDTISGRICSSWERIGENQIRYEFEIPANTTAKVRLLAKQEAVVLEDGIPKNFSYQDGAYCGTLLSGKYRFEVVENIT